MKRIKAICLLALALCLGAACAAADDYGTAVIDGRSSSRVHLRAEPTKNSDSLGLYFTGTEVTCKSDPNGDWVEVKIGRERGYMMSDYLKTGDAADRVTPRFKKGTVTAKNWARLRKGPSTEYQFICKVNHGTTVTIMGETHEHWYYVKAGKEVGFISGSLVSMQGSTSSSSSGSASSGTTSTASWKTAYRNYLLADDEAGSMTYALLYIDNNDVPELAIHSGAEAGGCRILTHHSGRLDVLQTSRLHFTYVERGGLLNNNDGHMGYYYDNVYAIKDGFWRLAAYGEYHGDGQWDEAQQRYVCDTYFFNGKQTTQAGYAQALAQVYPQAGYKEPVFAYSYAEILRLLE